MKKFCLKAPFLFVIAVLLLLFEIFSACTLQEEPAALRILVGIPYEPTYAFGGEKRVAEDFADYLQFTGGIERDDVEIEFLPLEEAERSVRLSSLRTEIMSGKGPDVFVLGSDLPLGKERVEYLETLKSDNPLVRTVIVRERLFQSPQRSMESGAFLPLDSYLKNAQFFDSSVIEPAILAAGQTDEGQMILPLTFTMPTAVYEKASTDHAKAEQCAAGATAWNQFPDLFGQIADYKAEKLLFSEAELLETVRSALAACPAKSGKNGLDYGKEIDYGADMRLFFFPEETGGLRALGSLHHFDLEDWQPNYFSGRWEDGAVPETVSAVPNREGGVTAQITAYACINRNTKRPDDAFQVLDLLIRREAMGLIAVKEHPEDEESISAFLLPLYADVFGVPVRNDMLGDGVSRFGYLQSYLGKRAPGIEMTANPETYEIYKNLRTQVTTARFYGELDWELQEMFNACREAKTDEEIEKIVSKAYDTMEMILAES